MISAIKLNEVLTDAGDYVDQQIVSGFCDRQAWDLTLDHCLSQLPRVIEDNSSFEHSPFFAEQLTAFQVWLSYGSEKRSPPEQLPIVLQVTVGH